MGAPRKSVRLGDAVRGLADVPANGGNFVAAYILGTAAKLRELVVSITNANQAAPNASITARVVAYLAEPLVPSLNLTQGNFSPIVVADITSDARVPGRVIADFDVQSGLVTPSRYPLCSIVEPGGTITIEVSGGDAAGAIVPIGVAVNLIGDEVLSEDKFR